MRTLPLLLFLLVLPPGCSPERDARPHEALPPARFARVYADLLVAGVAGDRAKPDSAARRRTTDSLLALRQITRAEFNASVSWYNADVARWREVMDSTTRILESDPAAPR